MDTKNINEILAHFDRTSDQFFSKDEFREKLKSGKKLRIKYGVDVTAPTLHIGHAVNLWLMRYLQDHGHKVIFLIGDFTTRIGDPDGKMDTRPVIPRDDIERNAREFIEQAKMVLRFDDPELLEVRHNADWLDNLPLQHFLDLLSQVTHAKLVSRDMFQKRIEAGKEIYMHELLYPVLQGWDSVAIESDMTIIGSDQLFNEMMGRFFQERNGQKPQTIITTKITPGTDGKSKQSKSVGNYVGLAHSPRDKFGRVMSIPDGIMEEWFIVYTDLPMTEIAALKKLIKTDPREAKLRLATAIVARYHGESVAKGERDWFENAFSKKHVPDDLPVLPVVSPRLACFDLVKITRPDKSKGDTRRLIKQGGVELNGEKVSDPDEMLLVKTNDVLKVGKRHWYRIVIVHINEIETERLWLKPLEIEDIDLLVKYLPEWEIVKYLTRPLSAKLAQPKGRARGQPFKLMKAPEGAASTKVSEGIAREVFKKVISQEEPKDEWLWKIIPKEDPDDIIGVAHLRRDFEHGNQNVWIDPAHKGQGLTKEVMSAVNTHAFNHLNFSTIVFKDAFAHAARELEDLRSHFSKLDVRGTEERGASFHVTREAWAQMAQQPAVQQPPAAPYDPFQDPLYLEEMMRLQALADAGAAPGAVPAAASPAPPQGLPFPGTAPAQPIPGQPLTGQPLPGQAMPPGAVPGQPPGVPGQAMPQQTPPQPAPYDPLQDPLFIEELMRQQMAQPPAPPVVQPAAPPQPTPTPAPELATPFTPPAPKPPTGKGK
jgi:tyrosyl-tRNA synthetase